MKVNTPSRTAQYMAFFRAIETARPLNKRLFTDPYALQFLDRGLKTAVQLSSLPIVGSLIPYLVQRKAPGALSSGIARTKYIDDLLLQTINDGVKQVLILGAGFDTRALRLNFLRDVAVIEIDHPDTSSFKIKMLESTGLLPANVKYLQLNFNTGSLDQLAKEQNIDFSLPATIIWEGVTNYLTADAVDTTFKFIQRFVPGSYTIFTYVHQDVLDDPGSFEGGEKIIKNLQQNEEPWTFGFIPSRLPIYLQRFHLEVQDDFGAAAYRARYMTEFTHGYEFYRVALTKRGPRI